MKQITYLIAFISVLFSTQFFSIKAPAQITEETREVLEETTGHSFPTKKTYRRYPKERAAQEIMLTDQFLSSELVQIESDIRLYNDTLNALTQKIEIRESGLDIKDGADNLIRFFSDLADSLEKKEIIKSNLIPKGLPAIESKKLPYLKSEYARVLKQRDSLESRSELFRRALGELRLIYR